MTDNDLTNMSRQGMQSGDPSELTALLDKAVDAHAAGNMAAAQELYMALLEKSPDDHVALHFLGVSYFQQGKPIQGIPYVEQALALKPDYVDAHFNLGCTLQGLNRLEEAIAHYESALAIDSDSAGAHLNLGNALQTLDRHEEAIAHYQQTLALRPEDADAYNNWGNSLQALNRHNEATACYERSLALRPDHAEAHSNLGNSLFALNRHDEARAHYEKALALKPEFAEAQNNLGHALQALNQIDAALACFARALAIKPDFAEAHNNWGIALQALNRHDAAIEHYERAIALKPDYAEAQWNKSLALLCLGRFREGWQLYEKRWRRKEAVALPDFDLPLWSGQEDSATRCESRGGRAAVSSRTAARRRGIPLAKAFLGILFGRGDAAPAANLLLQYEQGFGDAIQMLRYVPLLEQMGVQCWIQAPPALAALAQRSFPRARVVAPTQCPAEAEFRIPMLSLPRALKTYSASDIPRAVPYLAADEQKKAAWAARLANQRECTVGLVWRGRPTHKNDHNRSIPLATLAPLFSRKDIHFVTLQKGLTEAELGELAQYDNVTMVDEELDSFDDTAAAVSVLDLLISVDSAPAHLSGALGRPTWVLLPFSPDWRWLLAGSDSPWYPSARLFRQESIGDWVGAIRDVGDSLSVASLC